MMRNFRTQAGATIIELLVSVAIGLVIAASMFGVYVTSTINSTTILKTSKLNQELTTLMTVMVNDIRRAGYWRNAASQAPFVNPFTSFDNTVLTVVDTLASNTTQPSYYSNALWGAPASPYLLGNGECILYAYDTDLGSDLDENEIYGFRLNNGIVQMRQSGAPGSTAAAYLNNDDCTTGQWLDVTDPDVVTVDSLVFDLKGEGDPGDADYSGSECVNSGEPDGVDEDGDGVPNLADTDTTNDVDNIEEFNCYVIPPNAGDIIVETRVVNISLEGSLVSDPSVKLSLKQNVRVRNDLVTVAP